MARENHNSVPRDGEVRRWIYHNGKRGTQYHVDEISETGEIQNTYIYKYTTEGPIFRKQTYSRWKEELWIQKQEEGYKFIMGEKHKVENEEDEKKWEKLIQYYRIYCIRTYKDNVS